MENCKSIIAACLSYNKKVTVKHGAGRGQFSLSVCGTDYHIVIHEFLDRLAVRLKEFTDFKYKVFVDTGPLVEREILYRAGIARRGRNFCAVSEKFGSMFNCGYMLTDIDFCLDDEKPAAAEFAPLCDSCSLCIQVCPSGALCGNVFGYEKCVSYLTQKKGELSSKEKELIGLYLYGCDICQLVCPYNKGKETGEINDIDEIYPRLDEILSLTKNEFDKKYKTRAFYWRGLNVLKRNAEAVKGNLLESDLATP
jgi:epoxyqueuosine reductase